jgi:hypothetical protein
MDAKLAAKRAQRALPVDAENERLHQVARLRADSEYEEDVGLMELDEPAPEAPGKVHACA